MKVWLLDNGSIVIEHTQLMWNVPGPQVRIPVYSVLVESDDGLFLFDTGIDLDHMNRVLPFELPEQTEEQTIPAQLAACGFGLGRDDARQLAPAHRPRRRQQALHGHRSPERHPRAGARAGPEPRAVRVLRLLGPVLGLRRRQHRDGVRRRRAGEGPPALRDAGPHGRSLLAPRRRVGADAVRVDVAYTADALEKGIQAGFHNDPVAGVRSIARVKELAEEHGAEIFFSHDMDAWRGYKHAPDFYEL